MTRLDRLDILQIARERFGFHGTGGCCGPAALAINEVLFDNEGQIVMALNNTLLRRDEHFIGHVGVLDTDNVIWDSEAVYVGTEGFEDFKDWGMIAPDDPSYGVTEEEAQDAEVYICDTLDEAREIIGSTKCPHANLTTVLRAAMKVHFGGKA
jgi:hypothetical protein